MQYKDYYQILGVKRGDSVDEIKRAYRKLARKYHPDVSKEANAEMRIKEINEAYEVLKDPEKRATYDRLGASWRPGEEFRPPPDWNTNFEYRGSGVGDDGAFSDFFSSIFGGGAGGFEQPARRRGSRTFRTKGEDHHAKINIRLEDSFEGGTRTITLRVPIVDSSGHVVTRERGLNVKVPKGIQSGQRIRLTGQGTSGTGGGVAGDLYLEVDFEAHPWFRAEGKDIYVDLPVTPWEAALGATLKVPTLKGTVELNIPPNTANGKKLRLRARGLPGNPDGDQYVVVVIVAPPANSDDEKRAYEKFAKAFPFNPRQERGFP